MIKTLSESEKSRAYIALDEQYSAHNYHPLPVVLSRGEGVYVWDVDGKRYLDFLSGYSALNQGHAHPRILEALTRQASRLAMTSRAFHNDRFGEFSRYITRLMGYDKVLPMNSGAEAVETALKLCRKWAYEVKGLPEDSAKILVCEHNFHGRTISIVSFSSDPEARTHFGPYTPGFERIPYNDLGALAAALKNPSVAGFLVEPIQGEAGVVVPDEGYLAAARQYCQDAGVLFIADEIQTGLGRTGRMLCSDHEGVHPDILILGKALSGGTFPISAVLADDAIMSCIHPGEHGSTYGGSPLASAVAIASLEVLQEEHLAENAARMGLRFRSGLQSLNDPLIGEIRGKGLLNAIVIRHPDPDAAWKLCLAFQAEGLLAKPTHGDKIRLAPPLVITAAQIDDSLESIGRALRTFSHD